MVASTGAGARIYIKKKSPVGFRFLSELGGIKEFVCLVRKIKTDQNRPAETRYDWGEAEDKRSD